MIESNLLSECSSAMAFCGVSISSSTHPPPSHISHYLPSPRKPSTPLSSDCKWSQSLTLSPGRRTLIFGCLALLDLSFSKFLHASEALTSEFRELVRYIDSEQGFTLLVPSSWIKVPFLCFSLSEIRIIFFILHKVYAGKKWCNNNCALRLWLWFWGN